jgi:hypothetical protein
MPAKNNITSTHKVGKSANTPAATKRAVRAKPPTGADGRVVLAKKAVEIPAGRTATVATPAADTDDKAAKKAGKGNSKLVRDSFTMPEADFAVIALLKGRALGARRAAKKSELLRAGLRALAKLDAKSLVTALDQLETVKAGRPRKGH